MKKIITYACAASLLQLAACSKKDSGTTPTGTQTTNTTTTTTTKPTLNAKEKLLVGSWKFKSATEIYSDYDGNNATTSIMTDCQKDDIYTFSDTLMYSVSDGSVSCGAGRGYDTPSPWSISDGDSILQQFYFLNPLLLYPTPIITQLDQTTFILDMKSLVSGMEWRKYEFIYVFQRQ